MYLLFDTHTLSDAMSDVAEHLDRPAQTTASAAAINALCVLYCTSKHIA